jgi:hypothetical protein
MERPYHLELFYHRLSINITETFWLKLFKQMM